MLVDRNSRSSSPSSAQMNPYPSSSSNRLTVPVAITVSASSRSAASLSSMTLSPMAPPISCLCSGEVSIVCPATPDGHQGDRRSPLRRVTEAETRSNAARDGNVVHASSCVSPAHRAPPRVGSLAPPDNPSSQTRSLVLQCHMRRSARHAERGSPSLEHEPIDMWPTRRRVRIRSDSGGSGNRTREILPDHPQPTSSPGRRGDRWGVDSRRSISARSRSSCSLQPRPWRQGPGTTHDAASVRGGVPRRTAPGDAAPSGLTRVRCGTGEKCAR